MKVFIGIGGVPGHAYPAFALVRALVTRGHAVTAESVPGWREELEGLGASFREAPERIVFPGPAGPEDADPDFATVVRGLVPVLEELDPDVVIADTFGIAPAIAAELAGRRTATLVPHPWSDYRRAVPPWSSGFAPPRTPLGGALWRAADVAEEARRRRGKKRDDAMRDQLGLPRRERGGATLSDELVMVATYPQLEYDLPRPPAVRITGPLLYERPYADVELPPGDEPLVLVAASIGLDRGRGLLGAALEGLAGEPVRVLATVNEPGAPWPGDVPPNARVVDWISYAQVLPEAAAVITRGGHGTIVRALADGVPVLACPAGGDQAENAMRLAWAGAGLMLPRRLVAPAPIRMATRRLLGDPAIARRAAEIAAWGREHDGAERAAELLEETFA